MLMKRRSRLKDIGEFALIDKIRKMLPVSRKTLVGIGDDAAVLRSPAKNMLTLFTTDMLVEGTHFDLSKATPYRIGWKAVACSLSDIAAMGGLPVAAVVSIGMRGETSLALCKELCRGMSDCAERFGCDIVGGDTVGSKRGLVISVAMTGEVERKCLALRSGARPGDGIWVTGKLGGSLKERHLNFTPRVREARFLVSHFPVKAMMDLSDGLGSDIFRLVSASRVGARIEEKSIPLALKLKDNRTAISRALYDGEDFELLICIDQSSGDEKVIREFGGRFDCGITRIGTAIKRHHGIKLVGARGETILKEGGFSHFE